MNDNKGQISLEYLLIISITLILLIVFTLPLTELTIQNTLDITDAMDMKSDLEKTSQCIKTVYGQGQGSKQTVNIITKTPTKLNIANNNLNCNLKLNDKTTKNIKVEYNSNLAKTTIPLTKGTNKIIVEWPVDSQNMKIYKVQ